MRRWITKRWIIIVIAVVAIVAVGVGVRGAGAARRTGLEGLQTAAVIRGPLTATVGATGTVHANQLAVLTFETTGTVERVLVATGAIVPAGKHLAELSQSSLPAQIILAEADLVAAQRSLDDLLHSQLALAQAQLALANARDALKDAQRDLIVNQEGNRGTSDTVKGARARLAVARERMENAESVYDHSRGDLADGGPKANAYLAFINARNAYNTALASYNWYTGHPTEIQQAQLDADAALAQAQVDDAQREYDRLKDGPDPRDVAAAEARVAAAQATLNSAWVSAPFAGTITRVDIKPGDLVNPGSVAFELADLRHLLVDVDISEVDINRVQVGQAVSLTFDAILDRTYTGHVTEVGLVGASVQGVVNFRVTVELDDADASVRPGLTAAVNLVVQEIEDVLLVPNRAVRVRDGDRVVYVLREGLPQAVPIRLGVSSETDSQVLEGDLQEGDLIVLNPPVEMPEFGSPPPGSSFVRP
jgi:HlyD family secretion protein